MTDITARIRTEFSVELQDHGKKVAVATPLRTDFGRGRHIYDWNIDFEDGFNTAQLGPHMVMMKQISDLLKTIQDEHNAKITDADANRGFRS